MPERFRLRSDIVLHRISANSLVGMPIAVAAAEKREKGPISKFGQGRASVEGAKPKDDAHALHDEIVQKN